MYEYGRMYYSAINSGYELETVGGSKIVKRGGYLDALNELSKLGWELVCIDRDTMDNREYFLRKKIE